jgi:redox-sensitive bicupin YhaK (pirin superfamily)
MTTNTLKIISARDRDLGDGFTVRRLLPAIGRKMVGPFIFFDHMGPVTFAPGHGLDVRPHPHIGLATVTFMFEGAIMHRDSLGYEQVIRAGDVNLMTAGSGIVHSERSPDDERRRGSKLEGIQCWLALPLKDEETNPKFEHYPSSKLPEFTINNIQLKLMMGSAFGFESPVTMFSDTLYIDMQMDAGSELTVPAGKRELAAYLAKGSAVVGNQALSLKEMAVAGVGQELTIRAIEPSRLLVIGGEPFNEPREMFWNFVSSSKERLDKAKDDWRHGRFAKVHGDDLEFIPLPE